MTTTKKELPSKNTKLPFIVFLAIGAYFLWTEHQAHVIEYLPLAFLFACVGIHFFMHGSHGGHGSHDHKKHDDDAHPVELPVLPDETSESVSEQSETGQRESRHD